VGPRAIARAECSCYIYLSIYISSYLSISIYIYIHTQERKNKTEREEVVGVEWALRPSPELNAVVHGDRDGDDDRLSGLYIRKGK